MFIYFNKLGELTTIIPHGEIVRQGSWFTLNVALDDDVDISDKNMWFRYKRRGSERFTGDTNYQGHFDMIKEGSIPFKSLDPKEATFDLVDGKYYKVFSYKVNTDTGMTAIDGNVEVVFTLVTSDTTGGTEDVKMEGRANIYVEPTYGLHPERGLDLSVSEYATIMQSINQIQNSYKVKNVVVSQSENEVGDIENTITITYNDAKALTFKSMYIEKYLSDALVNTETMDLTITKSNGEVLTFSGITSEKVMKIILDNSVKGKTDVVLKTSKDKISTPTDNTTLTSLGIYQCFGAYVINLPSVSKGTISSEQLEILSQNRNAILMMNGIAYTYSMISNGAYSYHHISGSSEDLIYVNASTREWTTEHRTFEIGDLSAQIEQLKLDLQKKVDKIEIVSVNPYAYIQYTENGEPVQGSLRIMDTLPFSGTLVKRTSNGEITARKPTTSYSVTTKKYVDDALFGKLDKVTTGTDFVQLYAKFASGGQGMVSISMDAPRGGTIVQRTSEGAIKTANPTADNECTSKSYVDSALSTKADLVDGKVPASQLPAYVDDVVSVIKICGSYAELPQDHTLTPNLCICLNIDAPTDEESLAILTKEQWQKGAIVKYTSGSTTKPFEWVYQSDLLTNVIYITTEDNKTYRYTSWLDTALMVIAGKMVEISPSVALGETSSTAYPGDKGKADRDAISAIIDGGIKVYSAIHDQGGNVIDETYATKEAVDGKVDRIETSSIDGVYGLKVENSVDPFQTDSVFNPTSKLTPSTCGQYVIQYKTIIGLGSDGYGTTGLTYNITESSFTVTSASDYAYAKVAFRFNATAGQKYVLRMITRPSTYGVIQYFTADGIRLGGGDVITNNEVFTVPTYDQVVAYGTITIASSEAPGDLTIVQLEVVSLTASTTDMLYPVAEQVTPGTIPLRDENGNIKSSEPMTDDDVVPYWLFNDITNVKLDKSDGGDGYAVLYGVESNGLQTIFPVKTDTTPNAIPQLNDNGQLSSATPTDNTHVANKKYVDDALDGKLDKITTTSLFKRVYTINADGTQATMYIDTGPSYNTIVMRNADGQINTTTPTVASHAANKAYVDDRTLQMKVMTQSEYDALTTKDENTMYIIIG